MRKSFYQKEEVHWSPFRDADAISKEVIRFLDNEKEMHSTRKKAYNYGRNMTWSKVAKQYMESFTKARTEYGSSNGRNGYLKELSAELPPLNISHLLRMTDNTGMLQHAKYTIPDYKEGYTTDDNARALITMVLLDEVSKENIHHTYNLSVRYLAFLNYAFNSDTGRFRNFMSFDRKWLESEGSEDSHGRSLWALGTLLGRSYDIELTRLAGKLFEEALSAVMDFKSPRSWAYTILGINEYLRKYSGDRIARNIRKELTERLYSLFESTSTDSWVWFETS